MINKLNYQQSESLINLRMHIGKLFILDYFSCLISMFTGWYIFVSNFVNNLFFFLCFEGKMMSGLINANPVIYEKKERRVRTAPTAAAAADEYAVEPIDQEEIFDILSV